MRRLLSWGILRFVSFAATAHDARMYWINPSARLHDNCTSALNPTFESILMSIVGNVPFHGYTNRISLRLGQLDWYCWNKTRISASFCGFAQVDWYCWRNVISCMMSRSKTDWGGWFAKRDTRRPGTPSRETTAWPSVPLISDGWAFVPWIWPGHVACQVSQRESIEKLVPAESSDAWWCNLGGFWPCKPWVSWSTDGRE